MVRRNACARRPSPRGRPPRCSCVLDGVGRSIQVPSFQFACGPAPSRPVLGPLWGRAAQPPLLSRLPPPPALSRKGCLPLLRPRAPAAGARAPTPPPPGAAAGGSPARASVRFYCLAGALPPAAALPRVCVRARRAAVGPGRVLRRPAPRRVSSPCSATEPGRVPACRQPVGVSHVTSGPRDRVRACVWGSVPGPTLGSFAAAWARGRSAGVPVPLETIEAAAATAAGAASRLRLLAAVFFGASPPGRARARATRPVAAEQPNAASH